MKTLHNLTIVYIMLYRLNDNETNHYKTPII
nr:MAG TPA: hypothetical protein [Bacteriophage sp.]